MRELGRVARQVAVNMWGVEEVQMFAAIGRTARVVGGGYASKGRAATAPRRSSTTCSREPG